MNKKILLIDDKENVRVTLRDIFEQEGYTVVVATRGEEALDIIDKEKPDLALIDTEMSTVVPDSMEGPEVCRQIKQVRKLPIKVIIYTGTLEKIDAVKAKRMGAEDYIIKGEDPAVLVEAVKKLIGDAKN
jgi:two-component system response regulator (stage 0 sporulation protein F)